MSAQLRVWLALRWGQMHWAWPPAIAITTVAEMSWSSTGRRFTALTEVVTTVGDARAAFTGAEKAINRSIELSNQLINRNYMRFYKFAMAIGGLALLAPSYTWAAKNSPSSPIWDKLTPAWDSVSERLIDFAGEKKQKLLADLAFAAAAAEQCDGLTLDRDKFKNAFDSLNDADYKALSPVDKEQYGPKLMTFYGVYVGLITAEALLEQKAFCSYAINQQIIGVGQYWTDTVTDGTQQ
jgi:hypothetical protein